MPAQVTVEIRLNLPPDIRPPTLIARGTVEEKIPALQLKRRAIIKATLSGEDSLTENLTWEEIQGLFE